MVLHDIVHTVKKVTFFAIAGRNVHVLSETIFLLLLIVVTVVR